MSNSLNVSVDFIKQLKQQILSSRYRVAKIANAESLRLYFAIGKSIDKEIKEQNWGDSALNSISQRLQQELPGLRGFSASNLKKMRLFYNAWNSTNLISSLATNQLDVLNKEKSSAVTNQLQNQESHVFLSISFTHHFDILTAIKNEKSRWYYINKVSTEFWTVKQLNVELHNQSHLQEQNLPNNFTKTLDDVLSNKAIRAFKDQYLLDFVNEEEAEFIYELLNTPKWIKFNRMSKLSDNDKELLVYKIKNKIGDNFVGIHRW